MPETVSPPAPKRPDTIAGRMGCLAVRASAFCFYFSTVVIRWSQAVVTIDAAYFAFFLFLVGFVVVCLLMLLSGKGPAARRYHLLVGPTQSSSTTGFCAAAPASSASS